MSGFDFLYKCSSIKLFFVKPIYIVLFFIMLVYYPGVDQNFMRLTAVRLGQNN